MIYCTYIIRTVNWIPLDFSVFPPYSNCMGKKKRGRPPKPAGSTKEARAELRMSATEKQAFSLAADFAGLSLSSWIRERLRTAARDELEKNHHPVPFLP